MIAHCCVFDLVIKCLSSIKRMFAYGTTKPMFLPIVRSKYLLLCSPKPTVSLSSCCSIDTCGLSFTVNLITIRDFLTSSQHALWYVMTAGVQLGNVACHCYKLPVCTVTNWALESWCLVFTHPLGLDLGLTDRHFSLSISSQKFAVGVGQVCRQF